MRRSARTPPFWITILTRSHWLRLQNAWTRVSLIKIALNNVEPIFILWLMVQPGDKNQKPFVKSAWAKILLAELFRISFAHCALQHYLFHIPSFLLSTTFELFGYFFFYFMTTSFSNILHLHLFYTFKIIR